MGALDWLRRRRPPVPEAMRAHFEPDERCLGWAQAITGQIVAATPLGLHIVGRNGHRLIAWHCISKGVWRDGRLTITESRETPDHELIDQRPWALRFDEPGTVPVVLRERVEASVASTRYVKVDGVGVRLVGRKFPGRDGLVWQFRADPGLDTSDPAFREYIAALLAAERAAHTPEDRLL